MQEPNGSDLSTRWSRLGQLESGSAEAWRWFLDRYRGYVATRLRYLLRDADAAEAFWGYLLEKNVFARADRSRPFRAFLNGVVRNYAHALRRDDARWRTAETDPVASAAPDAEIRDWSLTLLDNALAALRTVDPRAWRALVAFYGLGGSPELGASAIGEELSLKGNAVHALLHRARARLGRKLLAEIRQTVSTSAELEAETALVRAALDAAGVRAASF